MSDAARRISSGAAGKDEAAPANDEGGRNEWLMSGPLPDWFAEEPDKQFGNVAEAWAEVDGYARAVSPRMKAQEQRALRMVFYAGARNALEALPESHSYDDLEARTARRWEVFVRDRVSPFPHPRTLPVFSPEAVQREFSSAIIDHQHGV